MSQKPSEKEQEYFVRKELERLKALREEHRRRLEAQSLAERKQLHWMHCPKCGDDLEETMLGAVAVDVCPGCGGLFLDAGELDKILEEQQRGAFSRALGSLRSIFAE
jgi:uncharacterized C2H2 Zn-finger protein